MRDLDALERERGAVARWGRAGVERRDERRVVKDARGRELHERVVVEAARDGLEGNGGRVYLLEAGAAVGGDGEAVAEDDDRAGGVDRDVGLAEPSAAGAGRHRPEGTGVRGRGPSRRRRRGGRGCAGRALGVRRSRSSDLGRGVCGGGLVIRATGDEEGEREQERLLHGFREAPPPLWREWTAC